MDLTTAAAIWGAALSTLLAVAQLLKWRQQHRRRIRIEILDGNPIWIDVINEGEREEQIAWVHLDLLDTENEWSDSTGVGGEDVVPPRGRKVYRAVTHPGVEDDADIVIGKAIQRPYRIRVVLGDGMEFVSAPEERVD